MKKRIYCLLMVLFMSIVSSFAQRQFFDLGQDFLLANFDLKPDEDDVHAAAALGCMLNHPDLAGVNYHAVAGAFGRQNGTYISTATPGLYTTLFGPVNQGWSDLVNDRNGTLLRVRNLIRNTLQAGNQVFVQEAGQSDFTYDVLQKVINETPVTINQVRNNVIVVQHSWNPNGNLDFNERQTTPFKLTWIKNNTDYQQVANGNVANNGTPGYKNNSTNWLAEAKSNNNPNALARTFWTDADAVCDNFTSSFENATITQRGGVDYSDNVEIWWIFNIGSKGVTNIRTFWDRYVVNTPSGGGNTGGGNNGGGNTCGANTNITGLNATAVSNTSINVSFTPLTGVNTYEVRTFAAGTFTGALQGATQFDSGSGSPIRVDGLTAGTSYTFAIRAICTAAGTSPLANINGTTSGGSTGGGSTGDGNNGGGTTGNCDFEESNGLVVIEAENLPVGNGPWQVRTSKAGFTGAGHIFYNGSDRFGGAGAGAEGVLSVKLQINTPGKYQFQFRSAVGIGNLTTEHNDTWLRFADASDFYGEKPNGQRTYPVGEARGRTPNPAGASGNGYLKLYVNSINWSFTTSTGDNADGRNVFVEFNSPGLYTMELAGRSNGHVIDRIVLHRNANNPLNLSNGQTNCNGGTTPPPPPPPPTAGTTAIPGTFQAEAFAAKSAGQIRAVDNNTALGFIQNNSYSEYSINVAQAGTYNVAINASAPITGNAGTVNFSINGNSLSNINITGTGAWTTYNTAGTGTIFLNPGVKTLRLTYTGTTNFLFNIGSVTLTAQTGGGNTGGGTACNSNATITGLAATATSNTSINVAFNTLSGASNYEVRTFAAGSFANSLTGAIDYDSGTTSPITVTGLTAGTSYTFAIRAICSGGAGTSTLVSVNGTTSGGVTPPPPPPAGGNVFFIVNRQTGKKLAPESNADGVRLIQVDATNNTNIAKWTQVDASPGFFYLRNVSTGKYFRPQTNVDGSIIEQRPTSYGGSWTQWKQTNTTNGYFYLENLNTGKYFRPQGDGNNSPMELRPTTFSGNYTQWKFEATSAKVLSSDIGITINVNPVSNGTLELSGANDASYSINSLTGSVVSTGIVTDNSIDVLSLTAGIYIVQFEKDGNLQIEKIVID